jgi:hypothetical protein
MLHCKTTPQGIDVYIFVASTDIAALRWPWQPSGSRDVTREKRQPELESKTRRLEHWVCLNSHRHNKMHGSPVPSPRYMLHIPHL